MRLELLRFKYKNINQPSSKAITKLYYWKSNIHQGYDRWHKYYMQQRSLKSGQKLAAAHRDFAPSRNDNHVIWQEKYNNYCFMQKNSIPK